MEPPERQIAAGRFDDVLFNQFNHLFGMQAAGATQIDERQFQLIFEHLTRSTQPSLPSMDPVPFARYSGGENRSGSCGTGAIHCACLLRKHLDFARLVLLALGNTQG